MKRRMEQDSSVSTLQQPLISPVTPSHISPQLRSQTALWQPNQAFLQFPPEPTAQFLNGIPRQQNAHEPHSSLSPSASYSSSLSPDYRSRSNSHTSADHRQFSNNSFNQPTEPLRSACVLAQSPSNGSLYHSQGSLHSSQGTLSRCASMTLHDPSQSPVEINYSDIGAHWSRTSGFTSPLDGEPIRSGSNSTSNLYVKCSQMHVSPGTSYSTQPIEGVKLERYNYDAFAAFNLPGPGGSCDLQDLTIDNGKEHAGGRELSRAPRNSDDDVSTMPDTSVDPASCTRSVSMQDSQNPNGGRRCRPKEEKYCGVCGDKALGYNFDAISCESCKAFFRRNANKGVEQFKCPYEEKCRMDPANRRFCKRCRLKRCFEIGMRKEYILTDVEKLQKRIKIESNRVYRDLEKQGLPPSKSFPATTDASPTSDSSRQQEPLPLEQEQADEIELIFNAYAVSLETSLKGTVMDPESKMHLSLPASACTQSQQSSGADGMCAVPPPAPGAPDSSSQGTAAASRTANGVAASSASPDATPTQAAGLGSGVGAGADANGSGPSTPASSASGGSGSTGSLLAAMMRASLPPNLSGGSLDSMIRTVTDMINLCEISMRRIIAFAKRLPAFKRLPQPEQMILLKGGSVELLILRGVIAYDLEHDVFHDPNDAPEVAVKQSTISSIEPSVFKSSQAPMYFVSVLAKDLLNSRIDQTSLVLLLLLVLLTPDRPGLTPAASELVEREQLHVALLLQRYLQSRMPCAIASSEFARLVSRLVQLRELGEEATSQFLSGGADTSGFQPLMFEVFSLTSGALAAPAEAVTVTADSSSQQPADMAAAAYSANSGLVP